MMMKYFYLAVFFSFCLNLSAAEPVFHLNFDKNTTPVKAAAGTVVKSSVPAKYETGIRGQAMLTGTDENGKRYGLVCSGTGNLNWQTGSISFWVNPVNWDGKESGFFASFFNAGNSKSSFLLYKYHEKDMFFFLRGGKKKTRPVYGVKDWQRGDWHHVVCTWDKDVQRLFCDGRVISEVKIAAAQPDPGRKDFIIGETASSMLLKGKGRLSLIDEFKIFDKVLSLQEVKALYNAENCATLPVQQITLGMYKDAFTATGLSKIENNELSPVKAVYTLGRDKQKFYAVLNVPAPANDNAVLVFKDPAGGKEIIKPMTKNASGKFTAETDLKDLPLLNAGKVMLFNIRCGKYDLNGFIKLSFKNNVPKITFNEAFDLQKKVYSVRAKKAAGVSLQIEGNSYFEYVVFQRSGSLNEKNYFTRHPLKKWQVVSFRFVHKGEVLNRLEYSVRIK